MSDGGDLGIGAERALGTILGGQDQPTEDEMLTKDQVRARLMAAKPNTYEGAADCIARVMLRTMEESPETRDYSLDPPRVFVKRGTGETIGRHEKVRIVRAGTYTETDWAEEPETVLVEHDNSLWDAAKAVATSEEREAMEGATGFMAGFAYNCARWLLDLPPAPNPAIVTFGSE